MASSTKRNGPPRRRSTKWSTAPTSPIIAGTDKAAPVYPEDGRPTRASEATRAAAARAVDGLQPNGGTAIGTWLAHVREIAGQHPGALTHAILLTDGKDEHETPEELGEEIGLSEGEFTCDCRGVGTDWHVEELRAISSALLGTVDIVADPADLADDFAAMMRASMGKSIPDLTLRLWTPAGARVVFVKQVAPTVEDLTHRRVDAGDQCGEYPLGAWGDEERDYHIQVEVEPAAVGREKLAARVTVVAGDEILGEGLVKAMWTTDTALSARISRRVAHYTGQAELAQAVQDGLAARKNGDIATATAKLRRAMELAVESGNDGTAKLLEGSSRSTSTPAPPGCDATSPRPTRWPSTRDRPEPRECGRRPDADLPRRSRHDGRRLLRRVRVAGRDRRSATDSPPAPAEGLPGVRGADQRSLLRGVRTRLGAARARSRAAVGRRRGVGRMDRRRHRRPGVLQTRHRPRRPRHRRVPGVLPGTPNHAARTTH